MAWTQFYYFDCHSNSDFTFYSYAESKFKNWAIPVFFFFLNLSQSWFGAPNGFKSHRLINEQGKCRPNECAYCKYQTDDQYLKKKNIYNLCVECGKLCKMHDMRYEIVEMNV